jgi:hypothetical protein
MPDPTPDKSNKLYSENNVKTPGGLCKPSAYDLALYPDTSSAGDWVLILSIHVQIRYTDGVSKVAPTVGQPLKWTDAEKQAFGTKYQTVCRDTWQNQFPITAAATSFYKTVRVLFDVQVTNDSFTIFQHWKLNVTKMDQYDTSFIRGERPFVGSDGELQSTDNDPINKFIGTMPQKNSAHEMGHMIGYRDEYPDATDHTKPTYPSANPFWLTDTDSLMNTGMVVRDRHYTQLAEWLTQSFPNMSTPYDATDPPKFRVNGALVMADAKI